MRVWELRKLIIQIYVFGRTSGIQCLKTNMRDISGKKDRQFIDIYDYIWMTRFFLMIMVNIYFNESQPKIVSIHKTSETDSNHFWSIYRNKARQYPLSTYFQIFISGSCYNYDCGIITIIAFESCRSWNFAYNICIMVIVPIFQNIQMFL